MLNPVSMQVAGSDDLLRSLPADAVIDLQGLDRCDLNFFGPTPDIKQTSSAIKIFITLVLLV